MRISDWSSDVCSSDLAEVIDAPVHHAGTAAEDHALASIGDVDPIDAGPEILAHIDAVLRRDEDMIAAVGRNPQQVGAVLSAAIPQQFCELAGSSAGRDHSRDVTLVTGEARKRGV